MTTPKTPALAGAVPREQNPRGRRRGGGRGALSKAACTVGASAHKTRSAAARSCGKKWSASVDEFASRGGKAAARSPASPIGKRKRRRRNPEGGSKAKKNPSQNPTVFGTAAAIGLALAGTALGYAAYRQVKKRKGMGMAVVDVLDPGGTIADAPAVASDVEQPVMLTTTSPPASAFSLVPTLAVLVDGVATPMSVITFGADAGGVINERAWNGRNAQGAVVSGVIDDSPKAITALVTDVTGDFAAAAYEWSLNEVANHDADFEDPTSRDALIRKVLGKLMPGESWASEALGAYGSPKARVWAAVQLLAAVAWQSYWNKQV